MNELKQFPVHHEQKVIWGDMDALGHLNNVIYYRYIESARVTYFEALGLFDYDVSIVVAKSSCNYLSSVVYPDTLIIGSRVEEIRQSAIRMSYALYSQQQNKVVATGEAVLVCINQTTQLKAPLPEKLKAEILNLEAKANHQPILL